MDNIPRVENIDSLVLVIKATSNKKSTNYLLNLITLERNRDFVRSIYLGQYSHEIDSLSTIHHFKFGEAFAQFIDSKKMLFNGIGDLSESIINSNQSLTKFVELNDSTAQIYANCALSRLHTRLQVSLHPGYLNREENHRNDEHFIQAFDYLERANKLAKQKNRLAEILLVDLISMNNKLESGPTEKYFDTVKKVCQHYIDTIATHPELNFQLCAIYNFYGNAYTASGEVNECLKLHLKALELVPHAESIYISTLSNNIGIEYLDEGNIDKALKYLHQAMDWDVKMKNYPRVGSIGYLDEMATCYAKLNNYKKAYYYKEKCFNTLTDFNQKNKALDYIKFENELAINAKDIEQIELKNKNRTTRILFGSALGLLSILGFFTFRIVRSRKKLSLAYEEIKILQSSRDKFLTIVAHDLRSPIQSYQNLAETISFLIKKEKFDDLNKISKRIDETGIQIDLMLTNSLSWSLSEQNQLIYKKEEVNIEQLFQEIMPLYLQMADLKKTNIIQQNKLDKNTFVSNKNYLSIVLRNLLDNAIKNATPDTLINIQTSLSSAFFTFSIQNFSAITSTQFDIIQSFFANNKNNLSHENGLGIGMLLIKEFLQKMNGTILLNHVQNKIEFKIQIPIV